MKVGNRLVMLTVCLGAVSLAGCVAEPPEPVVPFVIDDKQQGQPGFAAVGFGPLETAAG